MVNQLPSLQFLDKFSRKKMAHVGYAQIDAVCRYDTVHGKNPAPPFLSMKPYEKWDILHIKWCRISSINRMIVIFLFWGKKSERVCRPLLFFSATVVFFSATSEELVDFYNHQQAKNWAFKKRSTHVLQYNLKVQDGPKTS